MTDYWSLLISSIAVVSKLN